MRTAIHEAAAARGALVGSTAGAVSLAAHPLGGGVVHLSQSAVVQLVGVCAAIGVLAGSRRGRIGRIELVGLLAAGQAVGHTALTVGHPHAGHLTPLMLVAHLAAMLCAAVLIRAAETGLVAAASRVRRVIGALIGISCREFAPIAAAAGSGPASDTGQFLSGGGVGTRGPPAYR